MRVWLLFLLLFLARSGWAAPGYSVWGDFKYKPGFTHFDYVNPSAPKGGELSLVAGSRVSNFDKLNPLTIKGHDPSFLEDMLFESLLTSPFDELGVAYGLLAEDIEVSPDRLTATFRVRKEARFHNGDPVLAADVNKDGAMDIITATKLGTFAFINTPPRPVPARGRGAAQ